MRASRRPLCSVLATVAALLAGVQACGAAPPAEQHAPVVVLTEPPAPPPAPSNAAASAGPVVIVAPVGPADRSSPQALVESFFAAASAHQLQGMLDCFDADARAAESGGPDSVSRRLAASGVEIRSRKVLATSMSIKLSGGVRESTAMSGHEIALTEGGRDRTLHVTFRATQKDEDWYLTEVKEGRLPEPGGTPFDELFANAVREVSVKAVARSASQVVLDVAGATDVPAAGTRVDVYRVAGAGDRSPGSLVGIASGLVNRLEGGRVYIDVDTWPAGTTVGGTVVDPFKKGTPLKLHWSNKTK